MLTRHGGKLVEGGKIVKTRKHSWITEITSIEDLPEPYSIIASLIGIENTMLLASKLGGDSIYFPNLSTIRRQIRNRKIIAEYTGYNIRSLARKHHISVKRVQQIVKDLKPKRKSRQEASNQYHQVPLFDIE